jgi:hypothetical protein
VVGAFQNCWLATELTTISANGPIVAPGLAAGFGVEAQPGEPVSSQSSYQSGTAIVCLLEHSAVLVMLPGNAATPGRLRLAARRFQAQYLETAALAA